ncbi:MAG: flippase [Eggerthellaceae bacterium]|nr:flippase [Eggerthellaceae bacterium]MCH4220672.1 flippase [Eggerthellaceae bacterium]
MQDKTKKLFNNGIWLLALQAFNVLVPLLTIPYITRVLGAEQYGSFSLALNWIMYLQVIVEYGFTLTGARKVAIIGDDHEKLQKCYSNILTSRLFLLAITCILLILICVFAGGPNGIATCLIFLFPIVIGTALQQTWLFQGKQDMKFITLINAFARTISVGLIFLLISGEGDTNLYCILYSFTYIFSSVLGLLLSRLKFNLHVIMSSRENVVSELRDGWCLFTSAAMTQVFGGIGVTILGMVEGTFEVGVYSAIYKIAYVMIMMGSAVGQAIYPHCSILFSESCKKGFTFLKKFALRILPVFASLSILIIIFRYQLTNCLFGSEYIDYSNLLIPFIIWVFLSVLNNILGIQMLVASGHQREYSLAFMFGVIASVLSNIGFGVAFKLYGIAFAGAFGEFILTLALLYMIHSLTKKVRRDEKNTTSVRDKA